ncbi:hypothetical protein HDU96_005916 [Phlyctochytrium bullatum]|nr:hypothetical protein HDU96_005916 [Phlyctochytrium bullatum]
MDRFVRWMLWPLFGGGADRDEGRELLKSSPRTTRRTELIKTGNNIVKKFDNIPTRCGDAGQFKAERQFEKTAPLTVVLSKIQDSKSRSAFDGTSIDLVGTFKRLGWPTRDKDSAASCEGAPTADAPVVIEQMCSVATKGRTKGVGRPSAPPSRIRRRPLNVLVQILEFIGYRDIHLSFLQQMLLKFIEYEGLYVVHTRQLKAAVFSYVYIMNPILMKTVKYSPQSRPRRPMNEPSEQARKNEKNTSSTIGEDLEASSTDLINLVAVDTTLKSIPSPTELHAIDNDIPAVSESTNMVDASDQCIETPARPKAEIARPRRSLLRVLYQFFKVSGFKNVDVKALKEIMFEFIEYEGCWVVLKCQLQFAAITYAYFMNPMLLKSIRYWPTSWLNRLTMGSKTCTAKQAIIEICSKSDRTLKAADSGLFLDDAFKTSDVRNVNLTSNLLSTLSFHEKSLPGSQDDDEPILLPVYSNEVFYRAALEHLMEHPQSVHLFLTTTTFAEALGNGCERRRDIRIEALLGDGDELENDVSESEEVVSEEILEPVIAFVDGVKSGIPEIFQLDHDKYYIKELTISIEIETVTRRKAAVYFVPRSPEDEDDVQGHWKVVPLADKKLGAEKKIKELRKTYVAWHVLSHDHESRGTVYGPNGYLCIDEY